MKNMFSHLMVAIMLLASTSCSKQQDIAEPNSSSLTTSVKDVSALQTQLESLTKTKVTESGAITDMSKPFITGIDVKRLNLMNQINKLGGVHIMGWNGPFSITGNIRQIASNQEIFISNTESPTLASGIYFVDVYVITAEVTLPADAIAKLELALMPKYGYSNWTQKIKGVLYNQSVGPTGNVVFMSTYSLLPRYNSAGQQVSAPAIPAGNLTGMQFVYSYFQ